MNSITRAHGTQWFPGQAFTGFLYHEHSTLVNVDDEREWRWSSPEGIHLCFHDNTAGTGGDGGSTLTIGMALPDGSRSPLNLTLFRQRAVSDPSVSRYAALWIQRAAEDRPTDWTIPIVPLGWSAIQNDPRLDHDTQCALPIAGLLTNLAGMGNIGNPSFQLGTFALGTGEVVYKRA